MWVILGRAYVALMLMGNAWVMKHRNGEEPQVTTHNNKGVTESPRVALPVDVTEQIKQGSIENKLLN